MREFISADKCEITSKETVLTYLKRYPNYSSESFTDP